MNNCETHYLLEETNNQPANKAVKGATSTTPKLPTMVWKKEPHTIPFALFAPLPLMITIYHQKLSLAEDLMIDLTISIYY